MDKLIGLTYSPWTQRARWALEHCGVAYDYKEYLPIVGEPLLRLRSKQTGRATVPVLLTAAGPVVGSLSIARYAAEHGTRGLGDFAAIAPWSELSDAALAECRLRILRATLADDVGLSEGLAGLVPAPLRSALRFVARDTVGRLAKKYEDLAQHGRAREALTRTRAALQQSGGDFLLHTFSYADIAMVCALEMISPLAITTPPRGPATLRCWFDPLLAGEFADLLAWRERVISKVRPRYSQFPALRVAASGQVADGTLDMS